ncbi:multidrug transporter [Arenimonas maotaiensis]|uniref:Multidrug transporter n=1 Tax=Arenimonas maotaiensis TaxID=1446479 RepID=A0A917CFQ6_9GAMM|nr:efflux RND transporter permease subunit [Arenimonas maotaiensis]GGF87144.1 multidrug transporter [Arenimonas maotaiensis]
MILSDVSIKRPVFAAVISLMLVTIGLIAFTRLPLRELPNIDPPVVSIDVSYPGAAAGVVETRVTQVIEDAVAGIEGVDLVTSSSRNGRASVNLEFTLERDIESAANDVRDAVSRVADRLPEEADPPQVAKVEADAEVIIWVRVVQKGADALALTDYADRYIVDRFSSIPGVAQVRLNGGQRYAMRIWLDDDALTARGLTVGDVENALRRENLELPAGRLESKDRDFLLRVNRSFDSPEAFGKLVLKTLPDGQTVLLSDVARVARESAERRAWFRGNGEPQLALGIVKTSTANSLQVSRDVRAEIDRINPGLPEGMNMGINFDTTVFIDAAVEKVYSTLFEAIVLVLLVIWLFLGSVRASLIPAVTVPVCLMAAFIALWLFGYSINLLTLLALVLCIGLVVDDAIVVLENAQRRIDAGEPPMLGAFRGTRQVAFAVIATTAVLVAVFLPMAFIEGNNGRLFRELAVTMASAIAISALIALTLTPMMCSLILKSHDKSRVNGFEARVNAFLDSVSRRYAHSLESLLSRRGATVGAMLAVVALSAGLYVLVPKELAPAEDRGVFFVSVNGPEGAGFDYTVKQMEQVQSELMALMAEDGAIDRINATVPGGFGPSEEMHTGRATVLLKPWAERGLDTSTVVEDARKRLSAIAGVQARPQQPTGLVRGGGQPVQLVLQGSDYNELVQWRDRLLKRMEENPDLTGPDSDYKETRPQLRLDINRERAAALGVSNQEIGRTLESLLGSRRVGTYIQGGEEYDVIVQAAAEGRRTPSDLLSINVRTASGALVPLASVVQVRELAEPGSFNRFNRLRAITVSAGLKPEANLGEAIAWLQRTAAEELPSTVQVDYKGQSREYLKSGQAVMFTFALALLVVYLVLAAQFESLIHPLVILLTVPMAVFGALLGLWLMGGSLNLFSQVGIIMLIGLAAKNGILIVEFANQRRDAGLGVREAILEASAVRLRPILMTSIATAAGALPLMLGSGPGSGSRQAIGIVVVFGVLAATALTLYIVPVVYRWLAPYTGSPEQRARELERQAVAVPDREAGQGA